MLRFFAPHYIQYIGLFPEKSLSETSVTRMRGLFTGKNVMDLTRFRIDRIGDRHAFQRAKFLKGQRFQNLRHNTTSFLAPSLAKTMPKGKFGG